jgi:hypothetical protein
MKPLVVLKPMKKFKTFKGSQGLNCIASGAINFDPVVTVDAKMASSMMRILLLLDRTFRNTNAAMAQGIVAD